MQKLRAEVPRVGLHGAGPRSAWDGHAAEEEEEEAAESRRDPRLRPHSHSHSQSVAPPPPSPPRLAASVERSKEADAVARRLDALDDGVRAEGEHALAAHVFAMIDAMGDEFGGGSSDDGAISRGKLERALLGIPRSVTSINVTDFFYLFKLNHEGHIDEHEVVREVRHTAVMSHED